MAWSLRKDPADAKHLRRASNLLNIAVIFLTRAACSRFSFSHPVDSSTEQIPTQLQPKCQALARGAAKCRFFGLSQLHNMNELDGFRVMKIKTWPKPSQPDKLQAGGRISTMLSTMMAVTRFSKDRFAKRMNTTMPQDSSTAFRQTR